MQAHIKTADDLAWLLAHTQAFRGGYVTDIQVSKRRLFDEGSGREVLAGTTVTAVIRYQLRGIARVAKLTMTGVTDFSIFEQEGADCSKLGIIQAEAANDRLRFWFDPQGELYVVCEEAELEEVATPLVEAHPLNHVAQWTFQSRMETAPSVDWLLAELDQAGLPCSWRALKPRRLPHPAIQWEGDFLLAREKAGDGKSVRVMVYGPLDGSGFGIVMRVSGSEDRTTGKVLEVLADAIARRYAGQCLVGNTIIPGDEWLSWKML